MFSKALDAPGALVLSLTLLSITFTAGLYFVLYDKPGFPRSSLLFQTESRRRQ
jgi:hypothetical protein